MKIIIALRFWRCLGAFYAKKCLEILRETTKNKVAIKEATILNDLVARLVRLDNGLQSQ